MSIELSNGVVLPDIPSDVLAQYPYFLITYRVSTTALHDNYNFFAFNDEKPLCVGVDLSGGSQPILVAYAGTSYTYNSKALTVYSNPDHGTSDTEWSGVTSYTTSTNGYVNFLGSDGVGTTRVVASNFDIYNAATYEGHSTGFGDMTFTPGTEVYFKATHPGPDNVSPDPQKFLGVEGTQQLITNVKSYVNEAISNLDLPSGGSGEAERFIVTMTQEGTGPVTASHSSTEICDAIENGKIPIAMFDGGGMMAPVTMYDSAGVTFSLTMLDVEEEGGPVAVTVTYTVDVNKNVTVEMQVGEFLPRTGTAGQILAKNDQNISQWVNADTIKGAKGDKGDTGDQGPVGPAGADGKDGTNGTNGKDGYTPVRGTDYWTEADKAEIKSYVDEAILGGAW